VFDVSGDESAREAFVGAEVCLVVMDETALPWSASRFPVPEPGRILVPVTAMAAGTTAHTLRELETIAPPRDGNGQSNPADTLRPPAICFRPSEFAAVPGETVTGLVERLLAGFDRRQLDSNFRVVAFEDLSQRERPELTRHVPSRVRRLLDVGCGAGGSSAALRSRVKGLWVTGIEKDPESAARARGSLDLVIEGDGPRILEGLAREGERFDAFLFADVLEHLEHPVESLSLARALAAPASILVASVPNAGHLSLVRDLLLGRFDPVPAGLADAGHLRWFTRTSLSAALEEAGWRILSIESWPGAPPSRRDEFLSALADWRDLDRESLLTYQWIAVATAEEG
jgi:2-polyprenyl-3-methyl-5-hydroxy-6-metoxy-1,4-benzoquinol methylase